jgi:hypothetical protein
MGNSRTVETVLKYKVDTASVQAAEQSATSVANSLKGLGPSAEGGVNRVRRSMRDLRQDVTRGKETVEDLRDELLLLDGLEVTPKVKVVTNRPGIGDIASSVNKSGSVLSGIGGLNALGAAGEGFREAGQLGDITGYVANLAGSVSTLGPIAIVGTAAITGLGLALSVAAQEAERVKNETIARLNAERTIAEFLRDATTQQAQLRLEETRANLQSAELELQKRFEERSTILEGINVFDQFRAKLGLAFGEIQGYDEAVKEQIVIVNNLRTEQSELTTAMVTGATATNDAAEAERLLALERSNTIIAQSAEFRQNLQEDAQAYRGTSEAAKQRAQQLEDEAAALRRTIISLENSGDTSQQVTDQIEAYREELRKTVEDQRRLTQAIIPTLQAREKEIQQYEQARSFLGNLIGGARNLIGGASDGIQKLNQSDLKSRETFDKLARSRNDSLVKLAERLNSDLAKLNEDFGEQQRKDSVKRSEELAKFQKDEVTRTKEYYRSLRDIQRNFDKDSRRAAASLDANALQQSIESRNEQIEKAREQFDLESERRRESLDELVRSLDQQQQERASDYARRYNQLISANQAERAAVDAKYRADITAAQQNYLLSIGLLNNEVIYRRNTNNTILSDLGQYANQARSILGSIFNFNRAPQNAVIPDIRYISSDQAQREIAERNRQQQQAIGAQSLVTAGSTGGGTTNNSITINGLRLTPDELLRVLKEALG